MERYRVSKKTWENKKNEMKLAKKKGARERENARGTECGLRERGGGASPGGSRVLN